MADVDNIPEELPTFVITARRELDAVLDGLGADEVRVLTRIAERLELGAGVYGRLHLAGDAAERFRKSRGARGDRRRARVLRVRVAQGRREELMSERNTQKPAGVFAAYPERRARVVLRITRERGLRHQRRRRCSRSRVADLRTRASDAPRKAERLGVEVQECPLRCLPSPHPVVLPGAVFYPAVLAPRGAERLQTPRPDRGTSFLLRAILMAGNGCRIWGSRKRPRCSSPAGSADATSVTPRRFARRLTALFDSAMVAYATAALQPRARALRRSAMRRSHEIRGTRTGVRSDPCTSGRRRTHDRPRGPSNVHSIADEELGWFFKMAEGEAGSTLDRRSVALGFGRRIPARRAYRKIRGWIGRDDRSPTLRRAQSGGLRRGRGRRACGTSSGSSRVSSMRLAQCGNRLDQTILTEQQLRSRARVANQLEAARLRDGPAALIRFRGRAKSLLKTALRSYERERGDGPSAVGGLV